jgi:sRNA-binding protein
MLQSLILAPQITLQVVLEFPNCFWASGEALEDVKVFWMKSKLSELLEKLKISKFQKKFPNCFWAPGEAQDWRCQSFRISKLWSAPEAQDLKVLEWNLFTVFGAPETQRSQRLFRISKSELEKLKDVKNS